MIVTGTIHKASCPRENPRSSKGFISAGMRGSVRAATSEAASATAHQRRELPNHVMSRRTRFMRGARGVAEGGEVCMVADSTEASCRCPDVFEGHVL